MTPFPPGVEVAATPLQAEVMRLAAKWNKGGVVLTGNIAEEMGVHPLRVIHSLYELSKAGLLDRMVVYGVKDSLSYERA